MINTTNANGKMISRLLMSVSQNDIERTSERTTVGLAGTIKQGHLIIFITIALIITRVF
ncbi:MAG: hypothetical protein HFJ38_05440 [Bacilli bacterium]|nr:hypothetical protein [Bacilli bacterium]